MAKKISNDGSLQTTKQMLDELDALMERMLALPVHDGEVAAEAPIVSAKLTLLAAPAAPSPVSESPAPVEPAPEAAPKSPSLNPPHFARPSPPVRKRPPLPAPLPEPEPLTNEYALPGPSPQLEPLLAEISEPAPSTTMTLWCYVPLLWINHHFDIASAWFPGGAWLRSQRGRMFLGMSGMALTLLAAGWVIKDWLGWNWR